MERKSKMQRNTKETKISMEINLDGKGEYNINTGVGFLDHMLELFAYHGNFDLTVLCNGDTKVDFHHSVEDIGIVLGKLLNETLTDRKGIARYATVFVPMDESLARTSVDISGRTYLVFKGKIEGKIGEFDGELIEEFFRAVVTQSLMTAHIEIMYGENLHHMAEAAFKSFARALKDAVKIIGNEIPSSKGVL